MNQTPAYVINQVLGSRPTDDGNHLLLKTDQPVDLAVHRDALGPLFTAALTGIAACDKKRLADDSLRVVMSPIWWEFGTSQDEHNLVLMFRLPEGQELSFQVHRDQATNMRDVLATIAAPGSTDPAPGTTRQ